MHSKNQYNRYANLKALGFNPKRVLDIGAYTGDWSLMLKELFPEAKFTLVEPNEECIEKIKANGFDDVHNLLLGDTKKRVVFNKCLTGCGEGNSVFKEQSVFPFETHLRQMETLDDTLLGQYDLIKMDTQGSESLILSGGEKTLAGASFVQLETQVLEYNKLAPFSMDIINQMDMLGFKLYDIVDFHYNSRGLLLQVDLLFAPKNFVVFRLDCYS